MVDSKNGTVGKLIAGWLLFAAWLITITVLSSLKGDRIGALPFPQADKVAHSLLFLVGSFLLTVNLRGMLRWPRPALFITALVLMVLVGALDEIHQLFTPGRSGADPGDLAADAFGSALGAIAGLYLNGRKNFPKNLGAPSPDRET